MKNDKEPLRLKASLEDLKALLEGPPNATGSITQQVVEGAANAMPMRILVDKGVVTPEELNAYHRETALVVAASVHEMLQDMNTMPSFMAGEAHAHRVTRFVRYGVAPQDIAALDDIDVFDPSDVSVC